MRTTNSLANPDLLPATSPLPQNHKGPLNPQSANYHTSPAVKYSALSCTSQVPLQPNQMPTSAKSTRQISLQDTENSRQTPDLCPPSQSLDQASLDYSLSDMDLDDMPSYPADSRYPELQAGPSFEQDEEAYAPGEATMLESEEFSIISIDSLPSHVTGRSSPPQLLHGTGERAPIQPSYMASSPPALLTDRRRPVPEDSTPDHPQAPLPAPIPDPEIPTPLRDSARKSGKALQNVLNGPFRESVSRELPAARESIFDGFSSSTRRQLRQSLHTGQRLASSRDYLSPFHSPVQQPSQSRRARPLTPETDNHSQSLPSDDDYPSDKTSRSTTTPSTHGDSQVSHVKSQKHPTTQMQSPPPSGHDAIIESVVTSISAQAEGDEDKDIWQEEASRSVIVDDASPEKTDMFLEGLSTKPARNKLPGTWRRTSAAASSCSDPPDSRERSNRKISNSTITSSKKSSGVLTPPSSEDGTNAGSASRVEAATVQSKSTTTAEEELSQAESSDDTGRFFQANLPSIYSRRTRKPASDSAKSSFAPSSPLRNTLLDISPMKASHVPNNNSNANLSAGPSPMRRRLAKPNHSSGRPAMHQDDKADMSETQTDSSLASDAQQLQREMRRPSDGQASTISSLTLDDQHKGSRRAASANTIDLSLSSCSEKDGSIVSSRSRSYQEELNLESPMRVKVNFNDEAGNSTLLEPKRQYPPIFENIPAFDKPISSSTEASQPKSPLVSLTESFWEVVTKPPVYVSPERKPSLVMEPSSPAAVPDHILRLRRKYGLLPNTHPFIYAHIRTLHRMLNSTRTRAGSSIVPRSGPLGHNLSRLLGKSKTNELDQRFTWTQAHLHVVDSFMSLLLPQEERDRLQYETGSWGDDEALKHRGRDSKGRYGDQVVFEGVKGGTIGASWVADVLVDIVFKEEMNAKKKRIAEMMARAAKLDV
jgi:hypothetical protein